MAIQPNDLQPKDFTVKLKDKEYSCHPPRLSHRIILKKAQPLFDSIIQAYNDEKIEVSAEDIIALEKEVDAVFSDLVPDLKDVTLDMEDVVDLLTQIINSSLPEEAKELLKENVKVPGSDDPDPKGKTTGLS